MRHDRVLASGPSSYHIPEERLTNVNLQRFAHPFALMGAAVLAGAIPATLWAIYNARALGCRDVGKQARVLGLTLVLVLGIKAVALLAGPADLLGDLIENLALVAMIGAMAYANDRQAVPYKMAVAERGRQIFGILPLIVLMVVSDAVRSLTDGAAWFNTLWGGLRLGIF